MADEGAPEVPVWVLAAGDVSVPPLAESGPMTPDRLSELRTVLAALARTPIATLEVHPLPPGVDRSGGIELGDSSPLAALLSELISREPGSGAATGGEALYRMVVPARVAKQLGSGVLHPMLSKTVPTGIRSALVGSSGIAGQAAFVPVAGTGALSPAGGGMLIMMAVAAGLSAQIESARVQITEMLAKVQEDQLDDERNTLDSCRTPIEKATAILLDEGRIGQAIGLAPKVSAIEGAIAAALRRVTRWEKSLAEFPDGPVELATIKKAFPGIDKPAGEFRARLELAGLAIELKRRVNVLQAVEQAQMNPGNPFERFMQQLSADEKNVDELENRVVAVVRRLADLQVDRPHGVLDFVFTQGEVDDLLRFSRRLRELGEGIQNSVSSADMAIEIVRDRSGSVVVLPAHPLD